jgi:predicted PurR-regulated permease PerM
MERMTAKDCEIPRWWVVALAIGAGLLMAPFAGWIILAVWLSGFARSLHRRLTKSLRGHDHLAASITVGLMMLVLVPLGIVITILIIDALELVTKLLESKQGRQVLVALVSKEGKAPSPRVGIGQLILMQGDRAYGIIKMIAASAAQIIVGMVVLVAGIYATLINGGRWYKWMEEHAPMSKKAFRRFAAAFNETGHGLMVGVAGAGILQGIVATIAFLFLGVPQAFALGLLTVMLSIVPVVGTALVWVPVAIGLALTGRVYEGAGLAIFGITVIGSIDNLARPWLTRRGKLQLPGFVVLVAMFGGVELVGGWGILFGPLVVRLAKEALEVRREAATAPA